MLPIAEPLISQAPDSLFVYKRLVPTGGAAPQAMLISEVASNEAIGAGMTVITREAVIVRAQSSTKVQVSV